MIEIKKTLKVAKQKVSQLVDENENKIVKALKKSDDGKLSISIKVEIKLGVEDSPHNLSCGISYTMEKVAEQLLAVVDEKQGELFV